MVAGEVISPTGTGSSLSKSNERFRESIINCSKSKGGKLACDFVIEEGVHRGIQSVKAGVVEEIS